MQTFRRPSRGGVLFEVKRTRARELWAESVGMGKVRFEANRNLAEAIAHSREPFPSCSLR